LIAGCCTGSTIPLDESGLGRRPRSPRLNRLVPPARRIRLPSITWTVTWCCGLVVTLSPSEAVGKSWRYCANDPEHLNPKPLLFSVRKTSHLILGDILDRACPEICDLTRCPQTTGADWNFPIANSWGQCAFCYSENLSRNSILVVPIRSTSNGADSGSMSISSCAE
jgi:hypothetical protein